MLPACLLVSLLCLVPASAHTGAEAVMSLPYVNESGTGPGPSPAAAPVSRGSTFVRASGADWLLAESGAPARPIAAGDTSGTTTDPATYVPGLFIGRWVQEGPVPLPSGAQGIARVTTDYRVDETFSFAGTIGTPGKPDALTLTGEGVWSVTPLGGASFDTSLAGLMRLGAPGKPAASQLLHQQSRIEVVDRNTLRNVATGEVLRRVAP